MLGSDFGMVLAGAGHTVVAYPHEKLDVRRLEQVTHFVSLERPDCVIHAAALTNVDECERNPEISYAANTVGTWNVALACSQLDTLVVYVSSCGVFDGTKAEPYTEFDQPAPRTHYHQSKYLGEQFVEKLCKKYFIVRPGWLFGGSTQHRRNFVEARRREALAKTDLVSAKDKFGSPTYTVDFAEQVIELIHSGAYGVYHVANIGFASRYEYVSEIVKGLALPATVRPVGSDVFPRSAPVPAWEALDNLCLRLRGILRMRPWQEAMQDYVTNRLLQEVRQ
jgi:dTDP-4-dehydrorhamnose reductase